ncbi:uncharacterized protein PAE49_021809 isoform 2-T2 [Odontesthes bonariensis]|uniref:uncharacterized protein LOC142369129 n=1 Tax=Odontesthes bonariensis TaxID=219752 RepID=UPI003F58139B
MTRQVFTDAPFQLRLDGGNWLDNIQNGVSSWRAVTQVDLRTRSDTGKPNRSPQTTILPALRVPSNCQRDFRLLAFDPDADRVKCRFGKTAADECSPCSPPSVLTISPSCTLSFSPTGSETEGPYAVQIEMEDFPNQSLSLIQDDGVKTTRSPTDALSKIPVRFALIVDPAAPSCSEGLYLPRFLPPTPAYGAQLIAFINETLEVTIVAEAKESQISRLVLSGPHGVKSRPEGSNGQFILALTPSEEQNGETHPVCFVVQSMHNSFRYHSELHCVIVTIDTRPITTVPPSTSTSVPTTNQETTSTFPSTSVNQRKDGDKTRTLDEASVTETLA